MSGSIKIYEMKNNLKYEFRLALTDTLNAKIRYGKETCSVTVAMDKYVKGFLKCISDKDTSKFYCPVVSSVEWSKRNEVWSIEIIVFFWFANGNQSRKESLS